MQISRPFVAMVSVSPSAKHLKSDVRYKHAIHLWAIFVCINLCIALVHCNDDDTSISIQPTLQKRAGGISLSLSLFYCIVAFIFKKKLESILCYFNHARTLPAL